MMRGLEEEVGLGQGTRHDVPPLLRVYITNEAHGAADASIVDEHVGCSKFVLHLIEGSGDGSLVGDISRHRQHLDAGIDGAHLLRRFIQLRDVAREEHKRLGMRPGKRGDEALLIDTDIVTC